MKKTKKKVKKDIEKRHKIFKKRLSLGGENESMIESFFNTSGFTNPVQLIRLRSPKYGLPTNEVNGHHILTMIDDGYVDVNGFIHIRIMPDTPRDMLHHHLDEALDLYQSQTIPKEKTRRRDDEELGALEVWELRRLRKSFSEIAKELKIKVDTARKRYYTAYKIMYGKEYKAAEYDKPEIKKTYLKRSCETCDSEPTCTDLCPDVLAFVDEHTKHSTNEKLLSGDLCIDDMAPDKRASGGRVTPKPSAE